MTSGGGGPTAQFQGPEPIPAMQKELFRVPAPHHFPGVRLTCFLVPEEAGPCPQGHYCPRGSAIPQPCPPGTFSTRIKLSSEVGKLQPGRRLGMGRALFGSSQTLRSRLSWGLENRAPGHLLHPSGLYAKVVFPGRSSLALLTTYLTLP